MKCIFKGLRTMFIEIVYAFYQTEDLLKVKLNFFKEFFTLYFPFACGHIFGFVRGLKKTDIYVSFVLLRIQRVKINNYIRKNFCIKTRLFPMFLRHSILHVPDIRLFVSIRSGRDRQRPYCEHSFGVLFSEEISSLFLLFTFYVDILERIIFNLCDKHLLPIMLNNQYLLARKNYSARKNLKKKYTFLLLN